MKTKIKFIKSELTVIKNALTMRQTHYDKLLGSRYPYHGVVYSTVVEQAIENHKVYTRIMMIDTHQS